MSRLRETKPWRSDVWYRTEAEAVDNNTPDQPVIRLQKFRRGCEGLTEGGIKIKILGPIFVEVPPVSGNRGGGLLEDWKS